MMGVGWGWVWHLRVLLLGFRWWLSDSWDTRLSPQFPEMAATGSLGRVRFLHQQTSGGEMLPHFQDDLFEKHCESGKRKQVNLNCKFKPLLSAKWTSDCHKLVRRWWLCKDFSFLTQGWADFVSCKWYWYLYKWFIDENLVRVTANCLMAGLIMGTLLCESKWLSHYHSSWPCKWVWTWTGC